MCGSEKDQAIGDDRAERFFEHLRDESRNVAGPFYRRLVTAIRAVDLDHTVFLDGNTSATEFDIFDEPFENAVYTLDDYGSSNPLIDLPQIFNLYLTGRLPLDELLGRRRPLAEVNEAYDELRSGGVGRMILVP